MAVIFGDELDHSAFQASSIEEYTVFRVKDSQIWCLDLKCLVGCLIPVFRSQLAFVQSNGVSAAFWRGFQPNLEDVKPNTYCRAGVKDKLVFSLLVSGYRASDVLSRHDMLCGKDTPGVDFLADNIIASVNR
ncbi:hypothetical protein RF11_15968 [Thelohanellus kitauei]|uniref:Uncharacterized protein n=1 Tax=Thelohanellus kitauei TaxID=669202 RepID=A0A0C2IM63_THEKT|nr:hypothetical protein RF11_15968 [Thelohanellus kitauei]